MHVQQPQYNQHGQTAGEDLGTAYEVQQDVSEGLVRCAAVKTTCMATDNDATRGVSEHTRRQHRIHAGQLRRGKRATHIQGLRDSKNATQSRILARKCGRKYAK